MELFEQDFTIDEDDSESELEIQDKQTVTGKQTAWGVQVFKDWLREENLPENFEIQLEEEIDMLLARFYTEGKTKKTGQAYGNIALTHIRTSIQKHMRAPPWNRGSIIWDHKFDRSNKVINLLREKNEFGGRGLPWPSHHCPLELNDLKELRQWGVISTSRPYSLQNLVWIHIRMHFGNGTTKEWTSMNLNTFIQRKDTNGRRFIEYNTGEKQKCQPEWTASLVTVRMYERPKDPFCPVNAFNIYKSLLNKCVDCFWQRPDRKFRKTKTWYQKYPLSKSSLSNMMKSMCKHAMLGKSHNNFCLQQASRKILTDAGLIRTSDQIDLLTQDSRNLVEFSVNEELIRRKESYALSSVFAVREHSPDSDEEILSQVPEPPTVQYQQKTPGYDNVLADIKPPDDDDLFMDIKIEEEDPLDTPSTSDACTYNECTPAKRPHLDNKVNDQVGLTEELFIKNEEEEVSTTEKRLLEGSGRAETNTGPKPQKSHTLRNSTTNTTTTTITNSTTNKNINELLKDSRFGSRDIYDVFGAHIAKTLRDINDESTFRQVKMKINDILLEALAGHFITPENPQTKILLPVNTSPQFMILPGNSQNNSQMIVLPNNSQTAKNQRILLPSNSQTPLLPATAGSSVVYLSMDPGQMAQSQTTSEPAVASDNNT